MVLMPQALIFGGLQPMSPLTTPERIIVPLDVSSQAEALTLIEQLPSAQFFKVGLELFVSSGPGILEALKVQGKRIFLDLKFHDIPNTMAGACRAAARYGVDLLTIHATAGRQALEAAQQAAEQGAEEAGVPMPTLLAVTVLTSLGDRPLSEEIKVSLPLAEYVQHLAQQAQSCGIGGCVCSPQEIAVVRQTCGEAFTLVTPGVRPTWADQGDQRRVMRPGAALQSGANYLVVGRPITQAKDPDAAFRRLCDECA
jgi:orotidine-5'-phosphate decarboxylase